MFSRLLALFFRADRYSQATFTSSFSTPEPDHYTLIFGHSFVNHHRSFVARPALFVHNLAKHKVGVVTAQKSANTFDCGKIIHKGLAVLVECSY